MLQFVFYRSQSSLLYTEEITETVSYRLHARINTALHTVYMFHASTQDRDLGSISVFLESSDIVLYCTKIFMKISLHLADRPDVSGHTLYRSRQFWTSAVPRVYPPSPKCQFTFRRGIYSQHDGLRTNTVGYDGRTDPSIESTHHLLLKSFRKYVFLCIPPL